MKRIVLTLCVFIALSSLAHAAHAKECYDTTTGKTIFTNNPPPGAICEGDPGPALTPQERQQNARQRQQIEAEQASRDTDRQTDAANSRIEAAIDSIKNNKANYYKGRDTDRQAEVANDKIEALINQLMNDPRNLQTQTMSGGVVKTGGLKQHVLEQIVDLRKAQLRNSGNQSGAGQNMMNQQDDMEDKMKRQQREMEDKKRQQEAEIHRQEREIRDLKSQKEWAEHKARWNIK